MIKLIDSPLKHRKFKFGVRLGTKIWISNILQDMKRWASENQMEIYVDTLEIWFLTESDRTLFYLTWSDTDAI